MTNLLLAFSLYFTPTVRNTSSVSDLEPDPEPGFFADPDLDFKNPDPSVFCFSLGFFNKLNGCKRCSLIRFWRKLTKRIALRVLNSI